MIVRHRRALVLLSLATQTDDAHPHARTVRVRRSVLHAHHVATEGSTALGRILFAERLQEFADLAEKHWNAAREPLLDAKRRAFAIETAPDGGWGGRITRAERTRAGVEARNLGKALDRLVPAIVVSRTSGEWWVTLSVPEHDDQGLWETFLSAVGLGIRSTGAYLDDAERAGIDVSAVPVEHRTPTWARPRKCSRCGAESSPGQSLCTDHRREHTQERRDRLAAERSSAL